MRPAAAEETYRVQFTREAARARSVFEEKGGGCHRRLTPLGPEGSGKDGPNLSGLLTSFYPKTAPGNQAWSREALAAWIANPRAFRPNTLMPRVDEQGRDPTDHRPSGRGGGSVRASSRVGATPR
jgi:cytochrome c2